MSSNCAICNRFLSRATIEKHMSDAEKGYNQCKYCNLQFCTRNSLVNHLKTAHLVLIVYRCPIPRQCRICRHLTAPHYFVSLRSQRKHRRAGSIIMAQSSLGQVDKDSISKLPPHLRASAEYLRKWAGRLKWGDLSDSVVMDIGCGVDSGNLFNAVFPNYNKVIAIDKSPYYINQLRACPDKKMSYHVADITDNSTIINWTCEMKKIVSFYCFNCLTDQKAGFKNVHSMLRSGGEAIILTALKNPHYECAKVMFEKPKWKPFQTLINKFSDLNAHGLGLSFYETVLEEIGFHIIHLSEDARVMTFPNEAEFRGSMVTQDRVIGHELPVNLREEFKEEYFQTLMRLNGRTETGQFYLRTSSAHIILSKKEIVY